MLDLSREELIPLKTYAKTRGGSLAIFIEPAVDMYRFCAVDMYRFCAVGTLGTWLVDKHGIHQDGGICIVAIARKWVPKDGERVRIIGHAYTEAYDRVIGNWHGSAHEFQPSDEIFVNDANVRFSNLPRIRCGNRTFLVTREQLRRYVAPAASEELP